jgi:hypothetical protein
MGAFIGLSYQSIGRPFECSPDENKNHFKGMPVGKEAKESERMISQF